MGLRRIYVVELARNACSEGPYHERFGCLYVGETGLTAWQRFQKHLAGHKAGARKIVTKHGCRLRPDLYEGLPELLQPESVDLEQCYAARLSQAGYTVYTDGGWRKRVPASRLKPFTLDELPPEQVAHLDVAINSVLANPFRGVGSTMCAHVLWGSYGPEVKASRLVTLPEHGRFAHLEHTELAAHVTRVIDAAASAS